MILSVSEIGEVILSVHEIGGMILSVSEIGGVILSVSEIGEVILSVSEIWGCSSLCALDLGQHSAPVTIPPHRLILECCSTSSTAL